MMTDALRGLNAPDWPVLYLVFDWATLPPGMDAAELTEEAILGGVGMVQFRDKSGVPLEVWLERAASVRGVCRKHGVPFVVNDRVDAVEPLDAEGLHLGQDDLSLLEGRARVGSEVAIGISTHDLAQARTAAAAGADYLGFGAMFPTGIKPDRMPVGCALLRSVAEELELPVYPIGGIGIGNVGQIVAVGVRRCAVISAVMKAAGVRAAARELRQCLDADA
ncbi:MAG TPA: thiamine phosphate synthase [Verrucomicrobia bacterium]|jgi:thiamine-phosphate pyrophosphorylase|nr:thiamine phosphate synthase [Verrucomicrobiota bacterium]